MDPYRSVREFEYQILEYTGSPYAIAIDSCSNALLLCCHLPSVRIKEISEIDIPSITYPSVASAVVHAGGRINFIENDWQRKGWYELNPTGIVDSAKYLSKNMFKEIYEVLDREFIYVCLSFHAKKSIPIGRGGAILTNNKEANSWLRAARFDGRHEKPLHEDTLEMAGWNCYMTPEQASRGLVLMQWLPDYNLLESDPYLDLSKYDFFKRANRGV